MIVTINGCSHPKSLMLTDDNIAPTVKADAAFTFICRHVIEYGSMDVNPRPVWIEPDGTKVPAHTLSVNGVNISVDVSKGESPLLSLRRIAWKNSIGELLWIYQDASNDLNLLRDKYNVTWWDEWEVDNSRTIGACYGETVRRHDLMHKLLKQMEKDPDSRRHIISLWQDSDFDDPHGIKPCVHKTQFEVRHEKGIDYLDANVDIRSWDFGTAGAINQNQYLVFLCLVARHIGVTPGVITYNIGNLQLYDKHIALVEEMMQRKSIPMFPKVVFKTDETDFYKIPFEAIKIEGYNGKLIDEKNPQLKFPVAV